MRPVPVLTYHHVNEHKGDMVTVAPEVFKRQMRYLSKAGYRTLKADELFSYINGELSLDKKAVMVTFDDGWLDNYVHAFPILRKYNINATIFITTDWIERASGNAADINARIPDHRESFSLIDRNEGHKVLLNWELVREMSESGLIEFYSHTKSHRKCHDLLADELEEELGGSKRIMEEKLGRPCTALCWPFGRNNDLSVKIARDKGYDLLFTTRHGIVEKGSDPYSVNRIAVKDSTMWLKKSLIIYTNSMLSELYLKLKKLNRMHKIKAKVKARLRVAKRKSFPSVIQLQTTSACNAKCTCCPYHIVQKNSPIKLMPDDLYQKIIDECSFYSMKKISLYLFNEPLLDKKIIERLKYAKAKNPASQVRLSTNASLLNEKMSLDIANAVDFIYISIQGGITNKDRYEKVMGLEYNRMYKNIINFIEVIKTGNYNLKLNNTAINNVIPFKNEKDFEVEKKFWENKGLKTINFGGFSTWANKNNVSTNNYSKKIRGCSLKHRPLSHIHVLENGDVILCCRDWNKEIILGNLQHASISDIWNSHKYRDIIEKVYCGKKAENNFICYRCEDAIRL